MSMPEIPTATARFPVRAVPKKAMPIGCISSFGPEIQDILNIFGPIDRPAIVDLGIGFGLYGAALRQWIDFGRKPENFARIVGVEAFAPYKSPCWGCYDIVHNKTIDDWVASETERFNAILFNDVIEHFDKLAGLKLIERLKAILLPSGRLYVATPGIFFEQGALCGNQHEIHKSLWSSEDLTDVGFQIMGYGENGQKFDGVNTDGLGHKLLLGVFVA